MELRFLRVDVQGLIVISRTGIYIPLSGVDVKRFAESMQVRHTPKKEVQDVHG